jgi:hypothetical protein
LFAPNPSEFAESNQMDAFEEDFGGPAGPHWV